MRRLALLILVAALSGGPAVAEDSTSLCTMEEFWKGPASVEVPCSTLLARTDLSATERGTALFVRGRGYQFTRRFDQAAADFDTALQLMPANDELMVSRANIFFRLNDFDSGVEELLRALETNPRSARAYRALGSAYYQRNAIQQAIDYYGKALAADPLEAYARYFRSDLYMRLQRYPEAIADAEALVAIDPAVINKLGYLNDSGRLQDFHVLALTNRGMLFQLSGQPDKAAADYDAAVAFNANSTDAYQARANFRLAARQFDAALADADRAIAIDPTNEAAYLPRAQALFNLGRAEEAIAPATEAVRRMPGWAPTYLLRAKILRELGRGDEAATDFASAISLDRGSFGELSALVNAGYWPAQKPLTQMNAELRDAITACMLDRACN